MKIEVDDGPRPVSQSVRDLWDFDPALMGRVLRNLQGAVGNGSRVARGIQRGVSAWRRAEHWSCRTQVRDSKALFGILPNPGSRRVSPCLIVLVKGHGRYSSAGEGRVVVPNLTVTMVPQCLGRQGTRNRIAIVPRTGTRVSEGFGVSPGRRSPLCDRRRGTPNPNGHRPVGRLPQHRNEGRQSCRIRWEF